MIITHTSMSNDDYTIIDLISLALDMMLFGFVATVGTIYHFGIGGNTEISCNLTKIPIYLMISGYTNVVLSSFRFFVPLTGSVIQGCFNFAMVIYGSVFMFSLYPIWERVVVGEQEYCATLPFMTAFVLVIVELVWFATVIIVVLFMIGGLFVYGINGSNKTRDSMNVIIIPKAEWDTRMSKLRRYNKSNKTTDQATDQQLKLKQPPDEDFEAAQEERAKAVSKELIDREPEIG